MELSVVSGVLGGKSLDESLKYLSSIGVNYLELGVGGYPGTAHADAKILAKDKNKRKELMDTFDKYGMKISALSVHGNNVHPDKKKREMFENDFNAACELSGQIGIGTVVTFSGCPGSDKNATQPSWVTCSWPPEYLDELKYQWDDVLIPYWEKAAKFAKNCGVEKIAFEMHPGFCVYNPKTMLRLRSAVGDMLGANLDPSHLIWQGMEITDVIRELEGAIYYFHAKDTELYKSNINKNGVLDTGHYGGLKDRSWAFRTVGYGNGSSYWKGIISMLKIYGYDGIISIEHEDSIMSPTEGLEKAVKFLQEIIIKEAPAEMWWA